MYKDDNSNDVISSLENLEELINKDIENIVKEYEENEE